MSMSSEEDIYVSSTVKCAHAHSGPSIVGTDRSVVGNDQSF